MADTVFVNDARVMSKGPVTIPKKCPYSELCSICAHEASRTDKSPAKKAGFMSEDDIAEWITNSCREENTQ